MSTTDAPRWRVTYEPGHGVIALVVDGQEHELDIGEAHELLYDVASAAEAAELHAEARPA